MNEVQGQFEVYICTSDQDQGTESSSERDLGYSELHSGIEMIIILIKRRRNFVVTTYLSVITIPHSQIISVNCTSIK